MDILANYHTHTDFSDGKCKLNDVIAETKNIGLKAIGITDHSPVPFTSTWNMPNSKVDDYFTQIKSLKQKYFDRFEIYCGMEVDFFALYHDEIIKLSRIKELDYIIGSIHYLGLLNDGKPWCIDTSKEEFDIGVQQLFHSDGKRLFETYFEQTAQMISVLKPTIIGHIDKIRMYNPYHPYFDEYSADYRSAVVEVLKQAKKNDVIVELNMRGTYKHEFKLTYPDFWVLKEMKKLGIRVVVSSDSHQPSELIKNFRLASQLLQQAGYSSVVILTNNEWQEVSII